MRAMGGIGRGRVVAGLALLVAALAGCSVYRQVMGEDTVSLEGADVQRMEADIRRPVKTICPREPVQLWVTVDARLPDKPDVTRLETWAGDRRARRNGMLDFANFVFSSGQARWTSSAGSCPTRTCSSPSSAASRSRPRSGSRPPASR
jgi:hypothetical protein